MHRAHYSNRLHNVHLHSELNRQFLSFLFLIPARWSPDDIANDAADDTAKELSEFSLKSLKEFLAKGFQRRALRRVSHKKFPSKHLLTIFCLWHKSQACVSRYAGQIEFADNLVKIMFLFCFSGEWKGCEVPSRHMDDGHLLRSPVWSSSVSDISAHHHQKTTSRHQDTSL